MDTDTTIITRKYVLSGRVQGVGFRWFTKRLADEYGIKGFAKNQFDGSVLVVAQGSQECIESFERGLAEGPSYARVDRMRIEPPDRDEYFRYFEIR
ncbi:MAG: acylphosphatase [Candidatus Neomarinimicrobiota bacterium]|nr:acylphosphatase [Candidatus Neomarinimicrobiota bacterium]RKY49367.1 MAG: acylphosphatase [Candidatus Neomarinimicrobiota bacterium]